MGAVYDSIKEFKKRHTNTVMWRVKQHSKIIEKHINPGEKILYAFAGQLNDNPLNVYCTCAVALTSKRLLIAQKNILFGYTLSSITPDLFNDMQVKSGIIWGKITIDTAKEVVILTNLSKSSLDEIETNITEFMMEEKQKYAQASNR